jgi:hypothetical protein
MLRARLTTALTHALGAAHLLTLVGLASHAHADRVPTPTLPWAVTQLLPSPGLRIRTKDGDVAFTLRWQLTPLLWSFGVRDEVTPWRSLVVEPLVRYGGSVELFVAADYVGRGYIEDRFGFRGGMRIYVPLLQHGENLAFSLGASYSYLAERHGLGLEAGVYVLYGVLGLQVQYTPPIDAPSALGITLSVRYF